MELQAIKQRFGIIGNSAGINNALSVATRVAPTDLSVLILGESGVGKEVFSQIIHAYSARKHNAFIAVNCGAIPEGTIDSELFGHEKGSFTGAVDARKGYFEVVNGGTIFLDEIGEMPIGTQARLLRILESGELIRVGASKVQKTDVRIIAATNVNLLDAVKNNKFREDLYYRLNTVPIYIPPLRERKEDIYLLFRKFTTDFAERYRTPSIVLEKEAQTLLTNYYWQGNVRELKNIAEQLCVLATDKTVDVQTLTHFLPKAASSNNQLPVLSSHAKENSNSNYDFNHQELLYRALFDVKKELQDVKQTLFQLLQHTNFTPSNFPNFIENQNNTPATTPEYFQQTTTPPPNNTAQNPIILNPAINHLHHTPPPSNATENGFVNKNTNPYHVSEILEESLSLQDKERELIVKALKKHKGKRKEAALDLGMSERTIYRKIKDYNIKE